MFWFSRELFESLLSVNGAQWRLLLGPWPAAHVSDSETLKAGGFYCLPILHLPSFPRLCTLQHTSLWALWQNELSPLKLYRLCSLMMCYPQWRTSRISLLRDTGKGCPSCQIKNPVNAPQGSIVPSRWPREGELGSLVHFVDGKFNATVDPPFFTAVHRLLR